MAHPDTLEAERALDRRKIALDAISATLDGLKIDHRAISVALDSPNFALDAMSGALDPQKFASGAIPADSIARKSACIRFLLISHDRIFERSVIVSDIDSRKTGLDAISVRLESRNIDHRAILPALDSNRSRHQRVFLALDRQQNRPGRNSCGPDTTNPGPHPITGPPARCCAHAGPPALAIS